MGSLASLISFCLIGVLAVQGLAFLILGIQLLLSRPPGERFVGALIRAVYSSAFAMALVSSVALVASGRSRLVVPLGQWFVASDYHFHFLLQLDALSIPFLLLATTLCGVVALFSERYLHREPGFYRYFLLLFLFGLGDTLTVLAGSLEVLYCSWELLGLTSALLIAYFHEREGPVRNGLYTFIVYRVCDLGLLTAAVTVHHLCGAGDFDHFLGTGAWPDQHSPLTVAQATLVGGLLLLGAMGKSAQVPFSGWLPRAMEGPTTSTAIFYGALSVHAGAYLLLRTCSLLQAAPVLSWTVVAVGLTTAVMARFVGNVQTDIKCSLAYASMAQVGLIFAEIGLGFRVLPVVHAVGHAVLRSVQFLRAPSLLHEIHELHSALGGHPHRPERAPTRLRMWLYRAALERGYLETFLLRYAVHPFLAFCRGLQQLDLGLLNLVAGPPALSAQEQELKERLAS